MDNKKLSQLMMELYANSELKEEFIANPKKIMVEKGIELPENIDLKVLEETESVKYIVLPHIDEDSEINSESLERKSSKYMSGAF
jgi:hypothetical protein